MTHGYRGRKRLIACIESIGQWVLAAVGMAIVLAGCTTLKVRNDYDKSADFSGFHAFALMSREHHGTTNPLVPQRARDAIQSELTHKGFNLVNDTARADFVVDFTIGSHERVDVDSYPAPYAELYWTRYPDWWGYRYWGSQVDVRQYREGTLSIDIFDAHTHKPVWHGWATKELTQSDIENSEAPIRAAVKAVLESFPPQA